MNRIQNAVAGYITHAGKLCTMDDILAALPGFTPKQLENGINLACRAGWIRRMGKQGRRTAYGPGNQETCSPVDGPAPRGQYGHMGKVSSVFALGQQ